MKPKIQTGDKLKIGKNRFEILNMNEEVDFDNKHEKIIDEHLEFELHLIGNPSILPTHLLKVYRGKREKAVLLKIMGRENKSKNIEEKEIHIGDIKKLK